MATMVELGIETYACAHCKMQMFLTAEFVRQMRETHEGFYCPMGHNNFFPGKSEKEKLAEQLDQSRRELERERNMISSLRDEVQREKYSKAAYHAHFTRLKKKIASD